MSADVTPRRIQEWIDDDLVEDMGTVTDEHAMFNVLVDMSNIRIHVLRRDPDGPILVGQEIEYDEAIQDRIRELDESARNALLADVRETLTMSPVVYGFTDAEGQNVRFQDLNRIFVESRIYPDGLDQQMLMDRLVAVWKVLRYLDDLVTMIDALEER
jgi:hypothetical protein